MPQNQLVNQEPVGRQCKLHLLLHSLSLLQNYHEQARYTSVGKLTNARALAIGQLASLIANCTYNIFNDLFLHSLINLIALLLIAFIRLKRVTPGVSD